MNNEDGENIEGKKNKRTRVNAHKCERVSVSLSLSLRLCVL